MKNTAPEFYRRLGLDEDLIAHLLSVPKKQQAHDLELALQVMRAERAGHDPHTEPRHLTFEEFFKELGHSDEEIAEAQRRAVERHADL